jgi:hypothetical protein
MNLLPSWLNRSRRPTFSRTTERYSCAIDGSLMMIDRIINFPGRVIDLSTGGALFRPRLTYLLHRRDVPICLTIGSHELFGRIMGTNPLGFGLSFDEPLEEGEFRAILALSNVPVIAATRAA